MYKKRVLVFFLMMFFTSKISFSQCAMCKAVVENGDSSMAEGINNGITYLMVFPYLLVGLLLFVIYRYKRINEK
ncbi:hypothetical protein BTO15_06595 [Polaribacter sejongensis]|uniref:Adenylosuccinate synthetase n=2 Tax=Flavobacteriaceae TaxID=49546 RepID=A0ABM6PYE1_9FLAO|nr:hypothetical protein [Polaribacter sp. R2A056_3_33]AUC21796.1 hypothetical protein BTO15_06595 [Polaribacter sejongensis]